MAVYTNIEYTDMILIYGETRQNSVAARDLYAERFPNRRHPACKTIVDAVYRLRDTGSVIPRFEGRGLQKSRRVLLAEENILNMVDVDPGVSTTTLAREVNVSQTTVQKILKTNLLHPYHIQRVQRLTELDFPRRAAFCEWFQRSEGQQPDLASAILFTDESTFTKDGILNYHNLHHWAYENPHDIQQGASQVRISVNVWAGLVGDQLLGPHVLPERLNADSYLHFLQDALPEYLDDVPLALRQQLWFMHDGAPAHSSRVVQTFLNQNFPHWIGRGGHIPWPARSPDLNPLDFFLWGYMKSLVYDRRPDIENAEDLRDRIFLAAQHIRDNMPNFTRVHNNFRRRIDACLRAQGGHFEHHLL